MTIQQAHFSRMCTLVSIIAAFERLLIEFLSVPIVFCGFQHSTINVEKGVLETKEAINPSRLIVLRGKELRDSKIEIEFVRVYSRRGQAAWSTTGVIGISVICSTFLPVIGFLFLEHRLLI